MVGFIYMASPYSKYYLGIEKAFHHAAEAAARLIKRGHSVYSPIAHTHPIAIHGGIDALDHTLWLGLDAAMMEKADELWIVAMIGWQESHGIAIEKAAFQKAGKPIRFVSWPDLEISDECE